ncbi:MAG: hypothetical protein FWG03_01030 [Clostridiales bacterium]|nr:hypothetical protein [Clostridiales bacterium]
MSLAYLHESRAEIRRLLIAGAKYAEGDFRLLRLAKELGKAGEKAPAFARAAALLERCASPEGSGESAAQPLPAEGSGEGAAQRLLDAGAFVSAVLFTQAATGLEGGWEPWDAPGDALAREYFGEGFALAGPGWRTAPQWSLPGHKELPGHKGLPARKELPGYRELIPVVTALTARRAGRHQTIKEALESGLLLDYRLLPCLVGGLSDTYADIPPMCVKALTGIGRPALPMLLDGFDMKGAHREPQHRFAAIAGIAGKSGAALYRKAYLEGSAGIREMAVGYMYGLDGMEDLIQAAAQDPSKDVREAAERLLARGRPLKAIGAALFGRKKGG